MTTQPFDRDHRLVDAQHAIVPVEPSPEQTNFLVESKALLSAPASSSEEAMVSVNTQDGIASSDPLSEQTTVGVEPSPALPAPAPSSEAETKPAAEPTITLSRPSDSLLALYASSLDELEKVRIATRNRVDALQRLGAHPDSVEVQRLTGLADTLKSLEHGAELELTRVLKDHPLGPWIKRTIGVGDKQGARLLAAIGDPYWHEHEDRPRTVSELWAYCGLHVLPATTVGSAPMDHLSREDGHSGDQVAGDTQPPSVPGVAPKRQRGQKANWSSTAKIRALLVARKCIVSDGKPDKNGRPRALSPYRAVYEQAREKYEHAVHQVPCLNTKRPTPAALASGTYRSNGCGTDGTPAPVGSPLRPGHQLARAERIVAKAVLKDLWIEARSLR